ncbi:protein of unknown function [Paraburkholderia dioscoreae]|uniref:Uncharacterized protein n=1 Tax=Paraburkholderia dioscoreae TaxID=2604047 RepID=A0A5Q4ZJZ7_9BURK|nr:protein of unknown function [Paraburkholderia dioscoreae]
MPKKVAPYFYVIDFFVKINKTSVLDMMSYIDHFASLCRLNIVAVRNQAGFELSPWSTMPTTCSANSR